MAFQLVMEDDLHSSALVVRDRWAAEALSRPLQRHLVLSLVGREASVSSLVAESGMRMSMVHYHVRRLHQLGLLRISSVVRRAGRPVKRYTAAAPAFYVPAALMRERPSTVLDRELRTALERVSDGIEGTFFYRRENGGMAMRDVPVRSRTAAAAVDAWHIVELDQAGAERLAVAVAKLLRDAEGDRSGFRRRKHLVRFAMVLRPGDELFET